jgi:putative chitinase
MPISLTAQQLHQIVPTTKLSRLALIAGPLSAAMAEYHIDTPNRVAAFLGNIIVESDHLKTLKEYASGAEYEGRIDDLGNTQAGDGMRFKGRGVIQITGRSNYAACGNALRVDLITHPELLENLGLAMRSGGWFWTSRDLNRYADQGAGGFAETVYRVNGDVTAPRTHWDERVTYYKAALQVLGVPVPKVVPTAHTHHGHKKHKHRQHRHGHAPSNGQQPQAVPAASPPSSSTPMV